MTRDDAILVALKQFVEEAPVLSESGRYMRYEDGQPIALQVALAQREINRREGRTRGAQ